MRLVTRMAVVAFAWALPGCFPNYETEKDSVPAGMVAMRPNDTFVFSMNDVPFSVEFSHDFAIDRDEVTIQRYLRWLNGELKNGTDGPCSSGTCSLDPGGPYAAAMQWDATWKDQFYAHYTAVDMGGGKCSAPNLDGVATTYDVAIGGGSDQLPMTCVSWFQAAAFCNAEGKRLPTSLEWSFAATSQGKAGKLYTWGNTAPVADCRHGTLEGCSFPKDIGSADLDETEDGVRDMAGSVFEWVWDGDWSIPQGYPSDGAMDYSGPPHQVGLSAGEEPRTRRGGSFILLTDDQLIRNDRDDRHPAQEFYMDAGFRCAISL